MTTQEALIAAKNAGTPLAFIAKNINKDPSTLGKWARGTSQYMAYKTEQDIIEEIRRIKKLWEEIDI